MMHKDFDTRMREDIARMRRRNNLIWLIGSVISIVFAVTTLALAFNYVTHQSQHKRDVVCPTIK